MQVHGNSRSRNNSIPERNPSPGETRATQRGEVASGTLSCKAPTPPSRGHLLPLSVSMLEQLPAAMLAFQVGDFLEFDERSNLGEASTRTHAAMAMGTAHPLYAKLYAQLEACRQLAAGVEPSEGAVSLTDAKRTAKLARTDVNTDRSRRAKAERTRVAYAGARMCWALSVQKHFAANPRNVMNISSVAGLAGELGRNELAVSVLRWWLAQYPTDAFARLQLAEVLLQVRPSVDSGRLCDSAPAPDPAEHALTEARILKGITPKDARPRVIIAKALLLQAREMSRNGNQGGSRAANAAALAELREEPAVNDPLILAMVEHSLGNETASAAAVKSYLDGRHGRPVDAQLAEVYAWRGEPRLAMECLEGILDRNIHDKGLCRVAHSRFMDNIHHDKRWMPLLGRMNRAPDQLAEIPLEIELPP